MTEKKAEAANCGEDGIPRGFAAAATVFFFFWRPLTSLIIETNLSHRVSFVSSPNVSAELVFGDGLRDHLELTRKCSNPLARRIVTKAEQEIGLTSD